MYLLTILEAGNPRSRCQQGRFPPRPLWLAGGWLFPVCPHILPTVCVWVPDSFSEVRKWRLHWSSPYGPHFTLITTLKLLFPNTAILRYWGLALKHRIFEGDTVQPITSTDREAVHGALLSPIHSVWVLPSGQNNWNKSTEKGSGNGVLWLWLLWLGQSWSETVIHKTLFLFLLSTFLGIFKGHFFMALKGIFQLQDLNILVFTLRCY